MIHYNTQSQSYTYSNGTEYLYEYFDGILVGIQTDTYVLELFKDTPNSWSYHSVDSTQFGTVSFDVVASIIGLTWKEHKITISGDLDFCNLSNGVNHYQYRGGKLTHLFYDSIYSHGIWIGFAGTDRWFISRPGLKNKEISLQEGLIELDLV